MAIGSSTFSSAGGAVNDLFSAIGDSYKVKGARIEEGMYRDASAFATENERYTEQSYAIKQTQLDRQIYQSISGTKADVAGAGLAQSGSALDLLGKSASEGALTKQVLAEQGFITEEGYKVQAKAFADQADAAGVAADAGGIAEIGAGISAAIKGASALATL